MRTPHPPELHVESFFDRTSGFGGLRLRIKGRDAAIPTPAFHGGRLFFGGGFGNYEVYAIDAATGVLAWQLRTTDDGPTAVTVADGMAAYNTESCTVEVVNTASGERIWSRWLGDPLLAQPAVSDGRVFIAWPHAGQHRFGAFGLRDGRPLWETDLAHDIITAPVVCGDAVYVSSFDGAVSCFDASNGQRRWRREMNATSAPFPLAIHASGNQSACCQSGGAYCQSGGPRHPRRPADRYAGQAVHGRTAGTAQNR